MNVTQTQSAHDEGVQDLIDDDVEMREDVGGAQRSIVVVVDTNILVGHLDYAKKILSHGLGAMGFPVLAVPHVVVQELDWLKKKNDMSRTTQAAVRFINACLKNNQNQSLWVQSKQDAEEAQRDLGRTAKNNDDQVLQCCLQYQQSLHQGGDSGAPLLVLCTDDVNLRNKALPSGVKALSKAELEEEVEALGYVGRDPCHPTAAPLASRSRRRPDVHTHTHTHTAAPTLCNSPYEPPSTTERKDGERGEETETEEDRTTEISACVSLMEYRLREALSAVLEAEMRATYGHDLWREIVLVKPPWTSLQQVLRCVEKHWIAVFGDVFQRRLEVLSGLADFFTPGNNTTAVNRGTTLAALRDAATLLETLRGRSDSGGYGDRVRAAVSSLNQITLQLQPQADEENNAATMVARHDDAWSLFEHLDGMDAEAVPMEVDLTTWGDSQATVY